MYQTRCRHFSGYKPCTKNDFCNESCTFLDIPEKQILIIHQEAIGAVLRSTALLPAIKRKYPSSYITWVTRAPAHNLLKKNPYIDRILTTGIEDLLKLKALSFDVGMIIDKDISSTGIANSTKIEEIFGFLCDPKTGAILPTSKKSFELWELGVNNQKKFFENTKPETQLICEALDLPYFRDEYIFQFLEDEWVESIKRKSNWSQKGKKIIVGINTGCSSKMEARKLSVSGHKQLIEKLINKFKNRVQIVLLGGPEETSTNQLLAQRNVILSSTTDGLRDGMVSAQACDIIISGDSLGMHMGIALKKWNVVWFGPTCHQEIDLYDRGVKVKTAAVCSPCWKRECKKELMCYDQVDLDEIVEGVNKGIIWLKESSSSKQPFLGMSCSQSPSSAI